MEPWCQVVRISAKQILNFVEIDEVSRLWIGVDLRERLITRRWNIEGVIRADFLLAEGHKDDWALRNNWMNDKRWEHDNEDG